MTNQPDTIPHLPAHDDATLDASFAILSEEVRTTLSSADPEAFRLLWLGRKQGRLKLISEAWLKSAPAEARKPLGLRFNQLKQQIEAALDSSASAPTTAAPALDITLPGITRTPGIAHPLLATMDRVVQVLPPPGLLYTAGPPGRERLLQL